MSLNVAREVAALQRLTVPQLRRRYAEVYGETTNANNRAWLVRRIVWPQDMPIEKDASHWPLATEEIAARTISEL